MFAYTKVGMATLWLPRRLTFSLLSKSVGKMGKECGDNSYPTSLRGVWGEEGDGGKKQKKRKERERKEIKPRQRSAAHMLGSPTRPGSSRRSVKCYPSAAIRCSAIPPTECCSPDDDAKYTYEKC